MADFENLKDSHDVANTDYFPTKAYKRAVARLNALLNRERARLEALGPLDVSVCRQTLPQILEFTAVYENAYMGYLAAVLVQHPNGVQCKAGCGNCCRHYPMSVEPFEQIAFYAALRTQPRFIEWLEACLFREKQFSELASQALEKNQSDDPEEEALHTYFSKNYMCPFLSGNGNCGVYENRPLTCRMYFSETDSAYCTARWLLTEKNKSFIVYLPDVVEESIATISAFYEPLGLPEALYAGFVKLNALDGELFA